MALWQSPDPERMKGKRDRALLALLLACGLRRQEAVGLGLRDLEQREGRWAIVDLIGKGGHIRTVPIPDWVRKQLEVWIVAAGIEDERIFRRVDRSGQTRGDRISVKAIWHIVKDSAKKSGIPNLAPHDLRRTCARLCQTAGGELDVSIQTTERYLGSKQRIRCAVNDHIGIEPDFERGSSPQM